MGRKQKRVRNDFNKAMERLSRWCERGGWDDEFGNQFAIHAGRVCEKFDLTIEQLAEEIGAGHFNTIADCVFEDFLTGRHGPEKQNAIDDYLNHRGRLESARGKLYLSALRDSVMSLYEVIEVERGSRIILKDLVRGGDPIPVREISASYQLVKWDRLGCRVLSIGETHYLSGGVLWFEHETADHLLSMIRESVGNARRDLKKVSRGYKSVSNPKILNMVSKDDAAKLIGELDKFEFPLFGFAFTTTWLNNALERRRRRPPKLVNSDNEEVVFAEVRFTVVADGNDEIRHRFDQAEDLRPGDDDGLHWSWVRHKTQRRGALLPAKGEEGLTLETFNAFDRSVTVLGGIEIEDSHLILSTNSAERALRGKTLIENLLGGLIGEGRIEMNSADEAWQKSRQDEPRKDIDRLPPEQEVELTKNFMDEHYRSWINTPLPALEGKTPRQASRSKSERQKLCSLLKYLENNHLRAERCSGRPPYDSSWLWQTLGVADLR